MSRLAKAYTKKSHKARIQQLDQRCEELSEWLNDNTQHPDFIAKTQELNNTRLKKQNLEDQYAHWYSPAPPRIPTHHILHNHNNRK